MRSEIKVLSLTPHLPRANELTQIGRDGQVWARRDMEQTLLILAWMLFYFLQRIIYLLEITFLILLLILNGWMCWKWVHLPRIFRKVCDHNSPNTPKSPTLTILYSCSHSPTLTLTLTLSHSHTRSLTLTLPLSLSLSHTLPLSLSLSLSLSLCLSRTYTQIIILCITFRLILSYVIWDSSKRWSCCPLWTLLKSITVAITVICFIVFGGFDDQFTLHFTPLKTYDTTVNNRTCSLVAIAHDDVIKWKHFPRYWPFVRGIHQSPENSPRKGQWRGALMFSLICAWMNDWVNNREAGNLRCHRAPYDVTVM